jgi:uncharacterized protein YutE (UPF0331/DUF86 family)
MVRTEFIRRKLHLIVQDLSMLAPFRTVTHDELVSDGVRLAAVERMLERIVMRAVDVNQHLVAELDAPPGEKIARLSYRDSFLRLARLGVYSQAFAEEIAPSAGLRNILVHDYNDVDRRTVHASVATCLDVYPRYVAQVHCFLDRHDA